MSMIIVGLFLGLGLLFLIVFYSYFVRFYHLLIPPENPELKQQQMMAEQQYQEYIRIHTEPMMRVREISPIMEPEQIEIKEE